MKRVISFLMLASAISFACAFAAVQPNYQALTQSATIFTSGAELHQVANIDLRKGENEIIIEGLAPNILQQTLQVALPQDVAVASFNFSTGYLKSDARSVRLKNVQDSLTIIDDQISIINSQIADIEQMKQLLYGGVQHTLSTDKQTISNQTIEQNIRFYQQRSLNLAKEQVQLRQALAAKMDEHKRLTDIIEREGLKNATRTGILTLTLVARKNQQTTARISYFTQQASWSPLYDINIADINQPIDIILKAQVRQTTGIDWNNVIVTLSTSAPSTNNQLPELSTWYVSEAHPYTTHVLMKNAVAPMGVYAARAMDYAVEEEADDQPFTLDEFIHTTQQEISLLYNIDIPYTILGNGKFTTITLSEQQITSAEFIYQAVPKADNNAYLTAIVNDYSQFALIDATANVTFNGTFLGQTFINSSAANQSLCLTLTQDKQLTVKRERIADTAKIKTSQNQQAITEAYRITITNNHQHPITLRLKEQYPVSQTKTIQVALSSSMTPPTNHDPQTGILTYDLELQPAQTQQITIAFSIKYPKDSNINY